MRKSYDEALNLFLRVLEMDCKYYGQNSAESLLPRNRIAMIYKITKKYKDAIN